MGLDKVEKLDVAQKFVQVVMGVSSVSLQATSTTTRSLAVL